MTDFYDVGEAVFVNGSKVVRSANGAAWLVGNVKKGDIIQADNGMVPTVIKTDPVFDTDENDYWFELAFEFAGTSGSYAYTIVRTSSDWGTNLGVSTGVADSIFLASVNFASQEALEEMVTDATAAKTAAEAALDTFTDIYLGAFSTAPTTDTDGNPLIAGQIYLDTSVVPNKLRMTDSDIEWFDMLEGQQGDQGIGAGIQWTFRSPTTDGDPGPGAFRLNSTDHALVTKGWFDDTSADGSSIADTVMEWGTSTSSIKGYLWITNIENRAIYRLYRVTAAPTNKTGYREVTFEHVSSAGTLAPNATSEVVFIAKGDKGDTGNAGHTSGIEFEFSDDLTDTDFIVDGGIKFNSNTFATISFVIFDNVDSNGNSTIDWVNSIDDVDNAGSRGILRVQSPTNPATYGEFSVIGDVVVLTGCRKVPVVPISGSIATDGTLLVANFSPAGADAAPAIDGTDSGVHFTFDASTVEGNPSGGGLRFNDSDLTTATEMYISKSNRELDDISVYLATLDDSSNPTVKGDVIITRATDGAQFIAQSTGLTDDAGFIILSIQNGAGVSSFTASDPISFEFIRAGNVGASGAGSGNVIGTGPTVVGHLAKFTDTSGTAIEDSGIALANVMLASNNLSDLTNVVTAHDTLWVLGSQIHSASTLNLEASSGHVVDVDGTATVTDITLNSGHIRFVHASAAWTVEDNANIILNNGGSDYVFSADDWMIVIAGPSSKRYGIILPHAGSTGAYIPTSYLDADGTLAANSDTHVATQKAAKTYADAGYRPGGTIVAVADGGTGAGNASGARTNLGLGTIATQDAISVTISGGTILDITQLRVTSTDTGTSINGYLELYRNKGTPAANDIINGILAYGKDSAGNKQQYGQLDWRIGSPTSTTEEGELHVSLTKAGALTDLVKLTSATFAPSANDLLALGSTTLGWADIHGATGFTWNIANGNWVATHSNAVMTIGTGDLRVTNAGTDNASVVTIAGTQTLTNKTISFANASGLQILDTNASHSLGFVVGSDLTAARTLTLTTGDANRVLTISGDATINQNLSTTGDPVFATAVIGHTAQLNVGGSADALEVIGNTANGGALSISMFNATAGTGAHLDFYRSKSGTIGTATVVASGDNLGSINWYGAQQTSTFATQNMAAQIRAEVSGAVTSGAGADMPGRLVFATTADGAGTVTDRWVISSGGVLYPNANGSTDIGSTANKVSTTYTNNVAIGSGTLKGTPASGVGTIEYDTGTVGGLTIYAHTSNTLLPNPTLNLVASTNAYTGGNYGGSVNWYAPDNAAALQLHGQLAMLMQNNNAGAFESEFRVGVAGGDGGINDLLSFVGGATSAQFSLTWALNSAIFSVDATNGITSGNASGTEFSVGGGQLDLYSYSDSTGAGPVIRLVRKSPGPVDGDNGPLIYFTGNNSALSTFTYGYMYCDFTDVTSGTEDGRLVFVAAVAGTATTQVYFGNGIVVGTPTGAEKGTGAINAKDVYNDNVALTCMVLDEGFRSSLTVDIPFWDRLTADGYHEAAHHAEALVASGLDPRSSASYFGWMAEHEALPGMPTKADWVHNDMSTGVLFNRLWLSTELLALTVHEHYTRIETIEEKVLKLETELADLRNELA